MKKVYHKLTLCCKCKKAYDMGSSEKDVHDLFCNPPDMWRAFMMFGESSSLWSVFG